MIFYFCFTFFKTDFLPVACKYCQFFYCKAHFQPTTHDCESYSNEIELRILKDDKLNFSIKKIVCESCKKKCTPLEIINCNECKLNFCFAHRLQENHNCAQLLKAKEELASKSKKITILPKKIEEVKVKGARNDALSLKVAVMKLKQKAKGDLSVPLNERIYFYIQNKTSKNTIHEFYLCKRWSIGRCIAYLADELKIKNNNDKLDEEKLVLKVNDEHLAFERTLDEFILDNICDSGSKLIICYQNTN